MKSCGVTIQMKPLQQYFHMVLFVLYVVLTFASVDEILWYDHSMNPFQQYFHMALLVLYVVLTSESVDEILSYVFLSKPLQ